MSDLRKLRLGVNIDHVATVRNARGGSNPDPVRAALMAEAAGTPKRSERNETAMSRISESRTAGPRR